MMMMMAVTLIMAVIPVTVDELPIQTYLITHPHTHTIR